MTLCTARSPGFNPVIRRSLRSSVTLVSQSCEMRQEYIRLMEGRTAKQNPPISPFPEPWDCASKSEIFIMQRSLSKILIATANSRWYVTNHVYVR